jgi:hypothetical protein
MNFIPHGVSQETGTKGTDYYDKIKDVLDRIQEQRNDEEAKIAIAYDAEMVRKQELEEARKKSLAVADASGQQQQQQQQQQKRKRKFRAFAATKAVVVANHRSSNSINSSKEAANKLLHPLDLSWKDAGRIFPKRQSQIGPDYQVSALPEAGSYTPPEAGQELYEINSFAKRRFTRISSLDVFSSHLLLLLFCLFFLQNYIVVRSSGTLWLLWKREP